MLSMQSMQLIFKLFCILLQYAKKILTVGSYQWLCAVESNEQSLLLVRHFGFHVEIKGHLESIELFIEGQDFLRSYDSAPRPLPSHPSPRQNVVSLYQSSSVSPVELYDWRGGLEPNHTTVKKLLYKSFDTLWRRRTTSLAELTDSPIWSPSVMKAVQRLYLHNS